MSAETELWMLGISVAAAVVPWAFSLHAKVAVIASSVESLPRMLDELRETLEEHEDRLNQHDKKIEALGQASGAGR
jgi:ABC-type molybdate transport system permease subunit